MFDDKWSLSHGNNHFPVTRLEYDPLDTSSTKPFHVCINNVNALNNVICATHAVSSLSMLIPTQQMAYMNNIIP